PRPRQEGGLVVGSRFETDSDESPPCMGPVETKSYVVGNRLSVGMVLKFGVAQVSFFVICLLFKVMRSVPKYPWCCFKTGR
ncbi:hypothetical protein AVEN_118434-1, partial [Araneus ventricosus]